MRRRLPVAAQVISPAEPATTVTFALEGRIVGFKVGRIEGGNIVAHGRVLFEFRMSEQRWMVFEVAVLWNVVEAVDVCMHGASHVFDAADERN